ncbi:hypothetical protein CA13_36350 [Planctomycetes bacterium CA13]|uniref:DUF1365 domain-containing protein n=1 Tax=Novipirellula herctigrandis TaxID=2527986 RepID=A0A5C5Z4G1_9BACT|nr:hypothetical protein CA13_36350 [Planctomycetes bacterium CA13]
MHSCIYEGTVTHCRHEPVIHQFRYRLFMVYLDLAELPSLVGPGKIISDRKIAGRSLLRGDHLYDSSGSIESEVRRIVQEKTGVTPLGPIRVLSQLRYLGYYFSPLNLFYVFDETDSRVETIVAEVSNTPWKERHCYVLWEGNRQDNDKNNGTLDNVLRYCHPKTFHVSPFMQMDMQYQWRVTSPTKHATIQLSNFQESRKVFDASMTLQRRELTKRELRRMTTRYFLMTARIGVAIYFQALRLWWKKCPFYPHPKEVSPPASHASTTTKVLSKINDKAG